MSDHVLTEEALQFGEGERLFGILTVPTALRAATQELPVFVFLSAGLLHRVGPYRLHVRLSRELARMGFSSLRVDLAGMGDSPPCSGLTYRQSIAADFAEILAVLDSRVGRRKFVLAGLCTGADNATALALTEPRVVGMVLLDPICYPDPGFNARLVFAKYTNPANYILSLKRRFNGLPKSTDPLALRDLPNLEQLRTAFESIRERNGRVLSIFTQYALGYYNRAGQLGRVLGVSGYQRFCTEIFWPQTHHTYWLEMHRRRAIEEITKWAAHFITREPRLESERLPRQAIHE